MADVRRRALLVLLWALPALACVNPADPWGNESDFRLIQKHFTQYVRWGKVREAAEFVVPEQRQEFIALGPDLTDIRFTDWEIVTLEYAEESAKVDVQLRGYRLTIPVERTVHLLQELGEGRRDGRLAGAARARRAPRRARGGAVSTRPQPDGRPDILLVDDLALYRELEAHYLARVGSVRTAGNAAAAAAAVALKRPHIAVISLDLPDRPGEELVRELRETPRTSAIPVVALTRGSPGRARARRARRRLATCSRARSRTPCSWTRCSASSRAPLVPQGLPRVQVEAARRASGTSRTPRRARSATCRAAAASWSRRSGCRARATS